MRKSDFFASKWLKAEDLEHDQDLPVDGETGDVILTMGELCEEQFPDKTKPVLYFEETEKGLVVNITKWNAIEKVYGPDPESDWYGKKLALFQGQTKFKGDTVPCIEIRLKDPTKKRGRVERAVDERVKQQETERRSRRTREDDEDPFGQEE